MTFRNAGKRIALFGAGHLAAKFINLFGLKDLIECVIDDNPHKAGLFMPGSHLPIVGSAQALGQRIVDVCLLSLNPASEQQALKKYRAFAAGGGQFFSIFPLSPLALIPNAPSSFS